jgi:hypothetical protein
MELKEEIKQEVKEEEILLDQEVEVVRCSGLPPPPRYLVKVAVFKRQLFIVFIKYS